MRCYPSSFLLQNAQKQEKYDSLPKYLIVNQILNHIVKQKKVVNTNYFEKFGLDFSTLRNGNVFNMISYIR